MDVEFVLRVDDVLALHRYCLERQPRTSRPQWVLLGGCLLLTGLVWFNYIRTDATDFTLPLVLSACFLGLSIFALMPRKMMVDKVLGQLRRQLDDEWNRKLVGRRRLSVTPEAITFTSEVTTFSVRWPAVEQIVITEDHAFFLVTRSTGLILPIRAFEDEEAFREFVKTARGYRKSANAVSEEGSPSRRRSRAEETGFTAEEPAGG
jgi:hypothetical protein